MARGRGNLASTLDRIDERRRRIERRVSETRGRIERFIESGGARLAGFEHDSDLYERLLADRPNLHALLGPMPDGTHELPEGDRPSPSERIAALSRMVASVARSEEAIARDVKALQDQLATIERDQQWKECAYRSYEEFMERALGPDPRLSLFISVAPPPPTDALARVSKHDTLDVQQNDLLSSLIPSPPLLPTEPLLQEAVPEEGQLLDEQAADPNLDSTPPAWLAMSTETTEEPAIVVPEPIRPSRVMAAQRRSAPSALAIRLVVAAVAILVGAALGWSTIHRDLAETAESH